MSTSKLTCISPVNVYILKLLMKDLKKKKNVFVFGFSVFRCTLTAIPQTSSLLNKARLPLGILIHPFKDLSVSMSIKYCIVINYRQCIL